MANLYSGATKFTGYKSLTELTGLTFVADTKYTVQVMTVNNPVYIREGETGQGFIQYKSEPFEWTYDGVNDLYIGSDFDDIANYDIWVNVAG